MRKFHPDSWSHSARELCDSQVLAVKMGWCDLEYAKNFFSRSYRHPLIRHRAAKRFGRLLRAGKV